MKSKYTKIRNKKDLKRVFKYLYKQGKTFGKSNKTYEDAVEFIQNETENNKDILYVRYEGDNIAYYTGNYYLRNPDMYQRDDKSFRPKSYKTKIGIGIAIGVGLLLLNKVRA